MTTFDIIFIICVLIALFISLAFTSNTPHPLDSLFEELEAAKQEEQIESARKHPKINLKGKNYDNTKITSF